MVLNDLGRKINSALHAITKAPVVDEQTLDRMLKEICSALLEVNENIQADVNVRLVQSLRKNIKSIVPLDELGVGLNRRKIINKAVFDELCRLLDPGVEAYRPVKGRSNVIMFVGLQGSGKTTSCSKLAYHYQKKGWKVGLVCADTFRAGAFDQLKQNATKAKIPFYGSYSESDPVQLAMDGVAKFKQDKFEIIIVDTSGRHKQEADLFDEMKQIQSVVSPDNVIFVMDGAIGQAADGQARAFHETVQVGSIILTKMDGHAKGGGALSAYVRERIRELASNDVISSTAYRVAATGSPIIFIGTGEHLHDLESFSARSFVSKMLGLGDLGGLMETVQDLKLDENKDMMKRISQGQFSFRDLYEQFQYIMQLGPLGKVMSMLPGMTEDMFPAGAAEDSNRWFKKMLCMMDSMTEQELDSDGKLFMNQPSRVLRVCRGSGSMPEEMAHLLKTYKQMAEMVKAMGGKHGMLSMLGKPGTAGGGGGGIPSAQQMARMGQQMRSNPQMARMAQLAQSMGMGNMGNMQQMMQQLQRGGMPDLGALGNLGGLMESMGMGGMGRGGPSGPSRGRRRP